MDETISLEKPKKRHILLTIWLILLLVLNGAAALATLVATFLNQRQNNVFPLWVIWTQGLMAVLNVVFVVELFRWKKRGFWGVFCAYLILCALNFYVGFGMIGLLGPMILVAILFGVLQIGKENKGWPQLE